MYVSKDLNFINNIGITDYGMGGMDLTKSTQRGCDSSPLLLISY